jgi:hypothetical protein
MTAKSILAALVKRISNAEENNVNSGLGFSLSQLTLVVNI